MGQARPESANEEHHSSGNFPKVVGFAECRGNGNRENDSESRDYYLNGELLYRVSRPDSLKFWEVEEFRERRTVSSSRGSDLGQALLHALISPAGTPRRGFKSILLVVDREREPKAASLMYYLGGYPGYWWSETPEAGIIRAHYVDPNLCFLPYHRVPENYIDWLAHELVERDVLSGAGNRKLWVYEPKP